MVFPAAPEGRGRTSPPKKQPKREHRQCRMSPALSVSKRTLQRRHGQHRELAHKASGKERCLATAAEEHRQGWGARAGGGLAPMHLERGFCCPPPQACKDGGAGDALLVNVVARMGETLGERLLGNSRGMYSTRTTSLLRMSAQVRVHSIDGTTRHGQWRRICGRRCSSMVRACAIVMATGTTQLSRPRPQLALWTEWNLYVRLRACSDESTPNRGWRLHRCCETPASKVRPGRAS